MKHAFVERVVRHVRALDIKAYTSADAAGDAGVAYALALVVFFAKLAAVIRKREHEECRHSLRECEGDRPQRGRTESALVR